MTETIKLCFCGSSDEPHNFRHLYKATIFIDKYEDEKGHVYVIDATNFPSTKFIGKCVFPQCNAGKILHGTVIKHEFVPSEEYTTRTVKFNIPLDTLCRVCKEKLDTHSSLTHAFTTLVKIKNRTEHDSVVIQGKTVDQTIVWNA